ncbi:hypothetical protein [Bifidobacterium pseudolongum]|uniref:hypothetical protein n=1 Tax=Bifidobacterium pseudolongum TaxID=1694 RepID=UPI00101F0838|nr:hypothetical protein [Bifidobacterium pseudolongum]RYQ43029.1 hypothetical protein PG1805B_0235 [Bifidobacterium pseudolongum subsp. globosum]
MDNTTNTETNQQDEDGKLRAEAAKRRIAAREASERADAAEQEAAQLRAQIAELRMGQARAAVMERHPELTNELLDKFMPEGIGADDLEAWAEKSLEFVTALRGEPPVPDNMSPEEEELLAKDVQLARIKALEENPSLTEEALDVLCDKRTPDGIARWAAEYERIFDTFDKERMVRRWRAHKAPYNDPTSPIARTLAAKDRHGSFSHRSQPSGLQNVAERLTNR